MNSGFRRWRAMAGAGCGFLVILAGVSLSPPVGLLLVAGGGCLIGISVAAWLWRPPERGSPAAAHQGDRLDSVATALQEGVEELYALTTLSRMISTSLDLDQLLSASLKTVAATARVEGCCLLLPEDNSDRLVVRTASGRGTESIRDLALTPGQGLAGRVFRTQAPETHGEPFSWPDVPAGTRSVLALPLLSQDKGIGVLTFFSGAPSAFSQRQVAFFTAVANQLAAAVENANLYRRTQELSTRDGLTGLFNRRYFEETLDQELQRAERYRMPLSLIMADIDHFKRYNDTYGHPRGDEVLKAVAAILTETTRRVDIVARYGGEELVLVLPLTPTDSARVVAEKLRRAVEDAQLPGGLTVSLGVATYPQDGGSAAELIKAADDALYVAKQGGRNRVEVASGPA